VTTRGQSPEFIAEIARVKAATLLSTIISADLVLTKRGHEFVALCPFHNERTPSFTINDAKRIFHCFGCGRTGDVFDWLEHSKQMPLRQAVEHLGGRAPSNRHAQPKEDDWHPIVPPPGDAARPDLSGFDVVYSYTDADGVPLFYVRRKNALGSRKKTFVPLTFGVLNGKKGWFSKHPDAPRSLYGLARLAALPDAMVLICEGEKSADAAQRMFPDMACVCWCAGTANVKSADWSPLIAREVYIWPDNDASGAKAATEVAEHLSHAGIIRVDDLPHKADAADVALDDPTTWLMTRIADVQRKKKANGHADPFEDEYAASLETTDTPAHEDQRPAILVQAGRVDLIATAAEYSLIESGIPLFQRGRELVRPTKQEVPASKGRMTISAGMGMVNHAGMIDLMAQAIDWRKYDGRKKAEVACDPPGMAASILLARFGQWRFPTVAGVITTPTLRPDGSLLLAPGYDAATRLYHVPDPNLTPEYIPDQPTYLDAQAALAVLQSLLDEFPFVSDTDLSVALSGLITPLIRGAIAVAPLHAIRASTAGTGKSYYVDVASSIVNGRPAPVMSVSVDAKETESRMNGLLLAGFPLVSIDNVNGELGSDILAQAVERPVVQVRRLGVSDLFEVESRATWYATGNNLRVRGDMTRRSIISTMDAGVERPEMRDFRHRPADEAAANRGKYIAAILTIVRAYIVAGKPDKLPSPGSYEGWSDLVRSPLVWLGLPDPWETTEAAREDDPEISVLSDILTGWLQAIGKTVAVPVRFVIETANARFEEHEDNAGELKNPDFRASLMQVGGTKGVIDPVKIGKWFLGREGRILNGIKIKRGERDEHSKVATWKVV
jgi:putative DNA primase/helicase